MVAIRKVAPAEAEEMQLNALHMRFAAIAGGILLLAGYTLCGGSFGGDRIVQIDFGMDPDYFEGMQVEIDGRIAGKLRVHGQVARTGFEVGKGTHRVRVIHPEIESEPVSLDMQAPGQTARLMLQIVERYDSETRTSRPVLSLEY